MLCHIIERFQKKARRTHCRVYQDAIFDTKEKALPGVQVPKRSKNKDFQQIFGLLEVLFHYETVCRPADQRTDAWSLTRKIKRYSKIKRLYCYFMIEKAVVHRDKSITFIFKSGTEIRVGD